MEKRTRVRRTADETRQALVSEGLRQLQQHGVQIGLDHITLEGACAAADVPRSSSHAAWAIDDDYSPQALFQRTVLHAWLTTNEESRFAEAAAEALEELSRSQGEELSAESFVRAASDAAFDEGFNTGSRSGRDGGVFLSTDLALRFAIASQPDLERDEEVLEWLRNGEMTNRQARIDDSFKPMAEMLGFQPKPELGERAFLLFGIAVASLIEGIGLRHSILPELRLDKPLVVDDDDVVPATLLGKCVEALIPTFFDPVDVVE